MRGGVSREHEQFMRQALALAKRGYGHTSPNPMVGAMLVRKGRVIGRGWHKRAGEPHAEIEALRAAKRAGNDVRGATLYVTLEPCSTYGRTPPCTDTIRAAGIREVIVGATDPNPAHGGKGLEVLREAGIKVGPAVLADDAMRLNEPFNHWIVHRTPFVTVKTAMSVDGKIATRSGESKWITSAASRGRAMKLRQGADAILVGVNTILADNPALTVRLKGTSKSIRRIIVDSAGRTPLTSHVVSDHQAHLTTVVVGRSAASRRVSALERKVQVWRAPERERNVDLTWLLNKLGNESILSLLVEGGGEVNASFLLGGFAHRIAFFYAPIVIGGARAVKAVSGDGIMDAARGIRLFDVEWERVGHDLLLTARVGEGPN